MRSVAQTHRSCRSMAKLALARLPHMAGNQIAGLSSRWTSRLQSHSSRNDFSTIFLHIADCSGAGRARETPQWCIWLAQVCAG